MLSFIFPDFYSFFLSIDHYVALSKSVVSKRKISSEVVKKKGKIVSGFTVALTIFKQVFC